jgi:hypothetical protein
MAAAAPYSLFVTHFFAREAQASSRRQWASEFCVTAAEISFPANKPREAKRRKAPLGERDLPRVTLLVTDINFSLIR